MKNFGLGIIALSLLAGISLIIIGTVGSIRFEQDCEGYLKRAADANTVELARQELTKAVNHIEEAGLTSGSTHAFYATPECDLEFWYTNLKASLTELESLPTDADSLTRSNQLLKLRETIMDNGEKGTSVTAPPNVHVFPHPFLYRTSGIGSFLGILVGLTVMAANSECKPKAC